MGLKVLIVDDSAVMRRMITRTLQLSGLPLGEIMEAGDGAAGLAVIHARPVDLALVDINMPVMDGETMIDALRADPATFTLPVLVVSTESSEARLARLAPKVAGFVHKPFTPESLGSTIHQIVGGGHA